MLEIIETIISKRYLLLRTKFANGSPKDHSLWKCLLCWFNFSCHDLWKSNLWFWFHWQSKLKGSSVEILTRKLCLEKTCAYTCWFLNYERKWTTDSISFLLSVSLSSTWTLRTRKRSRTKWGWSLGSMNLKVAIDCVKIALRPMEFVGATGLSVADNSLPKQFVKHVEHRSWMACVHIVRLETYMDPPWRKPTTFGKWSVCFSTLPLKATPPPPIEIKEFILGF